MLFSVVKGMVSAGVRYVRLHYVYNGLLFGGKLILTYY